jgi:outer membrane murein-binding lipoprotein Lpp
MRSCSSGIPEKGLRTGGRQTRLGPGVAVQSGAQMRLALATFALAGLLLAGCSSGEPSAFKAASSARCLAGKGYRVTTNDQKVGVVAANAPNGGLLAKEPGNALTIAFGQDSDDAIQIAAAFKRFAPRKLRPHITDVLRIQKNAVLLWTVTPPQQELDTAYACLKG